MSQLCLSAMSLSCDLSLSLISAVDGDPWFCWVVVSVVFVRSFSALIAAAWDCEGSTFCSCSVVLVVLVRRSVGSVSSVL